MHKQHPIMNSTCMTHELLTWLRNRTNEANELVRSEISFLDLHSLDGLEVGSCSIWLGEQHPPTTHESFGHTMTKFDTLVINHDFVIQSISPDLLSQLLYSSSPGSVIRAGWLRDRKTWHVWNWRGRVSIVSKKKDERNHRLSVADGLCSCFSTRFMLTWQDTLGGRGEHWLVSTPSNLEHCLQRSLGPNCVWLCTLLPCDPVSDQISHKKSATCASITALSILFSSIYRFFFLASWNSFTFRRTLTMHRS